MQNYRFYFIIAVSVVLLFFLFYCYVISRKTSKYEDKFNSFALPSETKEKTLFDYISDILWKFVKFFSKRFSKSKLLSYYGTNYEKYINYNDSDKIKGIDFLSIKIIFCVVVFVSTFSLSVAHLVNLHYILIVLLSIISYFIPNMILEIKYSAVNKNVSNDILSAVIIINESLNNGKTIKESVDIVVKELEGAISDEFKRISKDLEYGISLSESFSRLKERVDLDSTKFISDTLKIYDDLNNNLSDIFDYIEHTLQDKISITNELINRTSAAIFIYKILIILPFILFVGLSIFNIDLLASLFLNRTGLFISLSIFALYMLYICLIKLVMQVEV